MMLFILLFYCYFDVDFRGLLRKQFKILAIYCCFYSLALVLSILILLDIPVTSPMVLIDSLLKSIICRIDGGIISTEIRTVCTNWLLVIVAFKTSSIRFTDSDCGSPNSPSSFLRRSALYLPPVRPHSYKSSFVSPAPLNVASGCSITVAPALRIASTIISPSTPSTPRYLFGRHALAAFLAVQIGDIGVFNLFRGIAPLR